MSYDINESPFKIDIKSTGKNWEELFEEAAYAVSSVIIDYRTNDAEKYLPIECSAKDIPELLIVWLNSILLKQQATKLAFVEYDIKGIAETETGYNLNAVVGGVKVDDEVFDTLKRYTASNEFVNCFNEEGQLACNCHLNIQVEKEGDDEEEGEEYAAAE